MIPIRITSLPAAWTLRANGDPARIAALATAAVVPFKKSRRVEVLLSFILILSCSFGSDQCVSPGAAARISTPTFLRAYPKTSENEVPSPSGRGLG